MTFPLDNARCHNESCLDAKTCLRFIYRHDRETPVVFWHTWPVSKQDCGMYWLDPDTEAPATYP